MSSKNNQDQELEVKLYLTDLQALQSRLETIGARATQPRVHEFNIRFDTLTGDLASGEQVLRLRQDTDARLTYKGPNDISTGVSRRQEIEFRVDDFAAARRLFEALGYEIEFIYEKYRAVYSLEVPSQHSDDPEGLTEVLVTLDQLPFGNFAEIEGPASNVIQASAAILTLDWEARILHSYAVMFSHIKEQLDLGFRDLTFANFEAIQVNAADLGVVPADAGN